MQKVRRVILILVFALVALAVVVLLSRNAIIKTSLPPAVKKITGFDAGVSDIDVGLFSSHVMIKSLKVSNPPDFPDPRMLDAPEIYVEYKPFTMLSRRREFPSIRLNIRQVVVVKNDKGESNVARIMASPSNSTGGTKNTSASTSHTVNHFGTLDLTLGSVVYLDYSRMRNGQPFTKEMTLNFHRTYHNLLDADLTRVVMLETLEMLPVKLKDISPESIQKDLKGVTGAGMGAATNIEHEAAGLIEGVGGLLHSKSK